MKQQIEANSSELFHGHTAMPARPPAAPPPAVLEAEARLGDRPGHYREVEQFKTEVGFSDIAELALKLLSEAMLKKVFGDPSQAKPFSLIDLILEAYL